MKPERKLTVLAADQVETEFGATQPGSCFVCVGVLFVVCVVRHSRALPQRLLSRRGDLPVAVDHLHHQPELQADDGDVHHHLGQDGRHAAGHWGDGEMTDEVR